MRYMPIACLLEKRIIKFEKSLLNLEKEVNSSWDRTSKKLGKEVE